MLLNIYRALIVSMLFSLATTSAALAGANGGGGGNAMVCRDSSGKITSAELFDFWEAEATELIPYYNEIGTSPLYGEIEYYSGDEIKYHVPYQRPKLEIRRRVAPQSDQIEAILNRIRKSTTSPDFANLSSPGSFRTFESQIRSQLESVNLLIRILPENVKVMPLNDAKNEIDGKSCHKEQLAEYQDDKNLLVDGEIWKQLSETDKAGLYIHEAIYRLYRELGDEDSRRTRSLVAHLFSSNAGFENIFRGITNDNLLLCEAAAPQQNHILASNSWNPLKGKTLFFSFIKREDNHVNRYLQFITFNGYPIMSKAQAWLGPVKDEKTLMANNVTSSTNINSVYAFNSGYYGLEVGNFRPNSRGYTLPNMWLSGQISPIPGTSFEHIPFGCTPYTLGEKAPM